MKVLCWLSVQAIGLTCIYFHFDPSAYFAAGFVILAMKS